MEKKTGLESEQHFIKISQKAGDGKDRRRWMVFSGGAGRGGKPEHEKVENPSVK